MFKEFSLRNHSLDGRYAGEVVMHPVLLARARRACRVAAAEADAIGNSVSSFPTSVPFPTPEGPHTTTGIGEVGSRQRAAAAADPAGAAASPAIAAVSSSALDAITTGPAEASRLLRGEPPIPTPIAPGPNVGD
eukprot:CAMPEP_0179859512 /NCGR_PEP_ID=MMETSP0982-20121206/13046_1 /TAXON_ID=483367 /ORGANISM="non described non described, Strain CCMP 2436" /LENGTH=133 /DNA_ID=CAMNT_0021746549 /DNA_START=727 /DNA_END=1129 /DNA_ORIENTATION=+